MNISASFRNPANYSNHVIANNYDYYNDDFWKLEYLWNCHFDLKNQDPVLGWLGERVTLEYGHTEEGNLINKRAVLLYGDSFAQCVDTAISFNEYLNDDSEFSQDNYLLNFGIGGYGVGQILMLFEQSRNKYEDPFVIFSVLTTDMERSNLSIRDAQKPFFILEEGELKLGSGKIYKKKSDFVAENPPEIYSYLWRYYLSGEVQRDSLKEDGLAYMDYIKELNAAILDSAFAVLNSEYKDNFVFLIFHPEYLGPNDWRLNFLTEYAIENELPFIRDEDLRRKDAEGKIYDPFLYQVRGDGHPNSYANKIVSEELKKIILNKN